MKLIFNALNQIKKLLRGYFVANEEDPKIVRKKHVRLGIIAISVFLLGCYFIQNSGSAVRALKNTSQSKKQEIKPDQKIPGLDELASGVKNEILWAEQEAKEVELVKQKQLVNEETQKSINERLEQDKVSKQTMEELMASLESQLEAKYKH